MILQGWITLGVIALIVVVLSSNRLGVDIAMLGGLAILMLTDALMGNMVGLDSALAGFAHPAVLMIGSLFVVAAGLQETGGINALAKRLLGRPRTISGAQLRMMSPVALMSGFMNNTPIVAMYLPIISDWCRSLRISPSKMYIPLSFSAILGGKITLIGTTSNIVVLTLYMAFFQQVTGSDGEASAWLAGLGIDAFTPGEQFWGIAAVGIPTSILGVILITVLAKWCLPSRKASQGEHADDPRYQLTMRVEHNSPVIGKSIVDAGLRHLPGLFLTHIDRAGRLINAVSPGELLAADDLLYFTGNLESVVDLRKIRGIVPATDQVEKVEGIKSHRTLVEAVVSDMSSLVGQTIRQSAFRTRYNAAIIAVRRHGESLRGKVGDITLVPGDTLLLDTDDRFVVAQKGNNDFYLVSKVEGSRPLTHERARISLVIMFLMVLVISLSSIPPAIIALTAAGCMVLSGCVLGSIARTYVNWQVLVVIGSALGIGAHLQETGAAEAIASNLMTLCDGLGPHAMLAITFALTAISAQLITNNGAAVIMFPIAMSTAQGLGVSPEPFVITLMVAAGSTYLSPVSYQTNMMVYGAGGYHFLDFARIGLPLTILVGLLCTFVAPLAFPFMAGGG